MRGISNSILRKWMHLTTRQGKTTCAEYNGEVSPGERTTNVSLVTCPDCKGIRCDAEFNLIRAEKAANNLWIETVSTLFERS